nr:unnamed protein product [Callosobruchus chinensis]
MRRLRDARRNDPETYEAEKQKERERYHRRKQQGKIKMVDQMSEREKRMQRKKWRTRSKSRYGRNKEMKAFD